LRAAPRVGARVVPPLLRCLQEELRLLEFIQCLGGPPQPFVEDGKLRVEQRRATRIRSAATVRSTSRVCCSIGHSFRAGARTALYSDSPTASRASSKSRYSRTSMTRPAVT